MKKVLSLVLALVTVLSLMPMTTFAADTDCSHTYEDGICSVCGGVDPEAIAGTGLENFEYTLNQDSKTVTLTKYIGTETAVIIPDLFVVNDVIYRPVLDSATLFRGNTTITSVTIGAGAAYKDNSMSYLFAECTKLAEVDLSQVNTTAVTDMSYLFFKCSALTALELSGLDTSKVTTMRGMFSYCTKLTELSGYENWDTGCLEVMYHMFNRVASGAGSMECIDLSAWDLDQVTNTGWCFQLCYAKQILLPDNLAVISAGFLNHATKITGTSYTIPAGVKKIGYAHTIYDFATNDFVEFIVAEGNTYYKAVDGILYSADGTEMLAVPRNKPFENGIFELPEGVTFLGELSFSRNYNITTLVLPDSYVIEYVPLYDSRYIVFEDTGNLNHGTNLSIAIYCYTGITEYAVKDTNPNYASLNGIIYSKDMTQVVAIPSRYAQPIVIPEGVTKWNYQASWTDDLYPDTNGTVDGLMKNCAGVSIPASLTDIAQDQVDKLNRIKGLRSDFEILVDENNPVYYVDGDGYLAKREIVITRQPESIQVAIGEKFAITVEAEGEGLTYQWYYKNNGGTEFAVSSFKGKSYAMTMAGFVHGRAVYCVITDANGNSVQTETVTITTPLTITKQPTDVQVEIGKAFSIKVEAVGDGLTYQWYYKNSGSKNFSASSFKGNSYAMTMTSYCHNRQVYCVITDAYGNSVTTDIVTITRPPITVEILTQPTDVQVEIGEKFSISVQAIGDGLTYQWYYKNDGSKNFSVSSFNGDSYAMTMASWCHNRQVYCVITDAYGNSVTTETVTITRPPMELKILTQPTDVYGTKGEKFSVSFTVQGEGLTYQWYYKDNGGKIFRISSNTSSAYAYTMASYHNGRQVYCVITDKYGNQVTTEVVTIHCS